MVRYLDYRFSDSKPKRGVAKVRISRVTIPLRDKPPGALVDILPIENGVLATGTMQICDVTVSNPYSLDDRVTYERVA